MISTFFYALITNRAYLAHWADENPIPLEILFEQPHVNWTYDPKEMKSLFSSNNNELLSFQQVDTLNQNYDGLGEIMFRDGASQDFNELWNASVSDTQIYFNIHTKSNHCYFFLYDDRLLTIVISILKSDPIEHTSSGHLITQHGIWKK